MNKDTAISFLRLVVSGKVQEASDKCVASGLRHHNPYFRGDAQSFKVAMQDDETTHPHKIFDVQHALEDGDFVAVHSCLRMNPGDIGMSVVHIFRFVDNKIVEFWDIAQKLPENSPNHNGAF